MIKAIIFDCFGVLAGDGFDTTYRYAGGDPRVDRDFIEELLEKANRAQITTAEFRATICEHLGITVEDYEQAIEKGEQPNRELLDYIKDTLRQKYKTAVLSNVNKGGLERRLGPDLLNEHFDVSVASGEVGYIKPEAEIYQLTADRLGVEIDECIFVDDREQYTNAAKKLGMQTILYKDFGQMKTDLEGLIMPISNN